LRSIYCLQSAAPRRVHGNIAEPQVCKHPQALTPSAANVLVVHPSALARSVAELVMQNDGAPVTGQKNVV